jgi:hypothetical protein
MFGNFRRHVVGFEALRRCIPVPFFRMNVSFQSASAAMPEQRS